MQGTMQATGKTAIPEACYNLVRGSSRWQQGGGLGSQYDEIEMVRFLRSGGVVRAWHAWRETLKNLGDLVNSQNPG